MKHKESKVFNSWNLVFPNDTNSMGNMFGGRIMSIMDELAGIVAGNFAGKPVVTASTEAIIFKNPVQIGDRIETIAQVVWTGRTSMVVKVDVYTECPISGKSRLNCTTAHFIFVALDENGKPTTVPKLNIETEQEKHNFKIAEIVKNKALQRKTEIEQADS